MEAPPDVRGWLSSPVPAAGKSSQGVRRRARRERCSHCERAAGSRPGQAAASLFQTRRPCARSAFLTRPWTPPPTLRCTGSRYRKTGRMKREDFPTKIPRAQTTRTPRCRFALKMRRYHFSALWRGRLERKRKALLSCERGLLRDDPRGLCVKLSAFHNSAEGPTGAGNHPAISADTEAKGGSTGQSLLPLRGVEVA